MAIATSPIPLDPVSDAEIARVYEERRTSELRRLAYQLNSILTNAGITQRVGKFIYPNLLISNIENRDADYLYFAIHNRFSNLKHYSYEGIRNFRIPVFCMYGSPYDEFFTSYYINYTIPTNQPNVFLYPEDWIPYVMMKHPDKISYLYLNMYHIEKDTFIEKLKNLLRGDARDEKIRIMIANLQVSPLTDAALTHVVTSLLKMIQNRTFDVLDSIYLLLMPQIYKETSDYSLLTGFKDLVSSP